MCGTGTSYTPQLLAVVARLLQEQSVSSPPAGTRSATERILTVIVRMMIQEHGLSDETAAHELLLTAARVAVATCGARKSGDLLSLISADIWSTLGEERSAPHRP